MTDPSEEFWEDLLLFVEEGKVVPVLGPELALVREGGVEQPLYRWLAQRLASTIRLPVGDLPEAFDLNDVVSLYVRRGGDRDDLYARLLKVLREAPPEPSPALRALAGIAPLRLFVSLSFDAQLVTALREASAGAEPRTVAYSTNAVRDLPVPYEEMREPLVFHLLGRASSTPEYAICDEDLLEFLHALQDAQRRPVRLFDALRANHLLILGCGFGDWLARFFLRTARGLELSQKRKRWDVLADAHAGQDPALTLFLSSFSADTKVLAMPATTFAEQLAQRWHAAHPAVAAVAATAVPEALAGPREGAVFVSYASENRAAAQRLADGLRAARLDVWFDQYDLHAGADWAQAIQRGIERCALFMPVISREALSEANRRRYFWGEWNRADELARRMASTEEFIVPVVVDDTRLDRTALPESFRSRQGPTLLGGELSPEIAAHLTELVRNFHRRRGGST